MFVPSEVTKKIYCVKTFFFQSTLIAKYQELFERHGKTENYLFFNFEISRFIHRIKLFTTIYTEYNLFDKQLLIIKMPVSYQ